MTLVEGGTVARLTMPQWYAAGVALLGGACPLALVEEGGYCEPITKVPPYADDECRHGRLPSDPTPPCGCFPANRDSSPSTP